MKQRFILLAAVVALLLGSCDKVNNKEVPSFVVRIQLDNYALWSTYGVSGVGDYRIFNRRLGLPSNFPYTVNTYTGYGGVLLMMGLDPTVGTYAPVAYDTSCPVEASPDITVGIDASNFDAVCAKCGSRYDVLQGSGGPKSGVAYTNRYGLRVYHTRAENGGYIIYN